MPSFHIIGGKSLRGTVTTPGSKNAVLPLMAAALLFDAPVTLTNVPAIRDVTVMKELLEFLGATVDDSTSGRMTIQAPPKIPANLSAKLGGRLRGSVLLLGPILARRGEVSLPQPGGDVIGKRSISQHVMGMEALGATGVQKGTRFHLKGKLVGADLYLEDASVTGTENILMAAVLATGETVIRHAAEEQHVQALGALLREAGAEIDGLGTSTLRIQGRGGKPLNTALTFAVPPDEIDAGTFAIAALITDGEITIDPYPAEALRSLSEKLKSMGAILSPSSDGEAMTVKRNVSLHPFQCKVGPAPGFATDLQPQMAVLATQIKGWSTIHDWMYDNRFGYVEELLKFGAHIVPYDQHRIAIAGPTPFIGQHIYSPDIRAGIAFVLAALVAEGKSIIDHANIIERGYAHLVDRLHALGADIERHD
jgi:UDP-N-acetylglucosamine 1-carboxyvinyltransferase